MKKIGLIVFLVGFFVSSMLFAQTKLDPAFNYISKMESMPQFKAVVSESVAMKTVAGVPFVEALIKTTDVEEVSQIIEDLGGTVQTKLKTVMTVEIPLDIVEFISELDEVVYVEASKPVTPKMDVARDTNVSNIVNIQASYDGSGVIVGIVDSGVDCSHADFTTGTNRIAYYYDQIQSKDYSAAEIAVGDCTDNLVLTYYDYGYHGTHVAGIAAGNDTTYKGVANGASIAVVQLASNSSRPTTSDVINAVDYVFDKATADSAPAVVNLSIGTSVGPHDNTSTFETGLNELVSGKQGRALVCAAGNEMVNTNDSTEGDYTFGGLHATVNVSGTDTGYEGIIRSRTDSLTWDVWLDGGKNNSSSTKSGCSLQPAASTFISNCNIEVIGYSKTDRTTAVITTGEVAPGDTSDVTVGNLNINLDFSDSNNALNNMQHAQAVLTYTGTSTYNVSNMTFDLVFHDNGGGCTGHAWMSPDVVASNVMTTNRNGTTSPGGTYTYGSANSDYMVTIPSTSTGCISVASFASQDTWTGNEGVKSQSVYDPTIAATGTQARDISLYSSRGPGAGTANTQKPDIAAPGEPIISTLSSKVTSSFIDSYLGGDAVVATDNKHIKLQGTSMASPIVTGVVALILERNPCLTPAEIKAAITGNVITDAWTGTTLPDYKWGYGKIDGVEAVNSVTADPTCVPSNSDVSLDPNNAMLSIVKKGRDNENWVIFLLLQLPILCLWALKRRRISFRSSS